MAEKVILHQKKAFQAALTGYKVSPHAQRSLDEVTLVALSGMAGTGRNTVIDHLLKSGEFTFLISDTTRPPKLRGGVMERDGVNYFFRSETDMLKDIQAGEFVEAELIHNQQVSGTSIREIQRAIDEHKTALVEVEYGGIQNLAHLKPDALIIGLLPPSWDEWLRRFVGREDIHPEEFLNRLNTAKHVLKNMLTQPYFLFVINDDVERAVEEIMKLVENRNSDDAKQTEAQHLAESLLEKVEQELSERVS